MESYFIYVSDSESDGPYGVDEIKAKVSDQTLTGEHYLWHDEGTGWIRAETLLPQLFGKKIGKETSGHSGVNFESITSNPYRVLGIPIDATKREKTKAVNDLKRHAGQKKEVPSGKLLVKEFTLSAPPQRSVEELEDAVNRIQQVAGKLNHAHMWFWEGNAVDKKAFQCFSKDESQDGIKLLERNVEGKGVSANNFSSVRNLGLYYLDKSTAHDSLDSRFLNAGIQNLGKFCNSEYFDEYSQKAGDERLQVESDAIRRQMVDYIYNPLKGAIEAGDVDIKGLVSAFKTFPENLRKYLSDKFTGKHISDVESFVEEARKATRHDPAKGYSAAKKLHKQSEPRLLSLGKVLGSGDYQLDQLKTEIAKAMRHCVTEYHNHHNELGDKDPGKHGLEITKLALLVCSTGTIAESLKEDIEFLKEWNRNSAKRKKQKSVNGEIEKLGRLLEGSQDIAGHAALDKARSLINGSKPILNRIKSVLGEQDEEYKKMSDVVAAVSIGLLIDYANTTTDCASVVPLMEKIGQMDMSSETKSHWSRNFDVLRGNVSAGSEDGGGCLASIGKFLLSLWWVWLCLLFAYACD